MLFSRETRLYDPRKQINIYYAVCIDLRLFASDLHVTLFCEENELQIELYLTLLPEPKPELQSLKVDRLNKEQPLPAFH